MAKCYDQFPEHVRQLYSINYGYLVRARVRVRLGIGLGLGLTPMVRVRVRLVIGLGLGISRICSGQSQCVLPFHSVNYHILVNPERDAVVPLHRSVLFRKLYQRHT